MLAEARLLPILMDSFLPLGVVSVAMRTKPHILCLKLTYFFLGGSSGVWRAMHNLL
jgi:hypothetical protein